MVRLRVNAARSAAKTGLITHCNTRAHLLASKKYPALAADYCMRSLSLEYKQPEILRLIIALGRVLNLSELETPSLEYLKRNSHHIEIPSLPQSESRFEELTYSGIIPKNTKGSRGMILQRQEDSELCWVADRYWNPGEVLISEYPIHVALTGTLLCTHCGELLFERYTECNERLTSCNVKYCSEACRDRARTFFHAPICGNQLYKAYEETCEQIDFSSAFAPEEPHGQDMDVLESNPRSSTFPLRKLISLRCKMVGRICAEGTACELYPITHPSISPLYGRTKYVSATVFNLLSTLSLQLGAALRQPVLFLEDFLGLYSIVQRNATRVGESLWLYPTRALLRRGTAANTTADGHRIIVSRQIQPLENDYFQFCSTLEV